MSKDASIFQQCLSSVVSGLLKNRDVLTMTDQDMHDLVKRAEQLAEPMAELIKANRSATRH